MIMRIITDDFDARDEIDIAQAASLLFAALPQRTPTLAEAHQEVTEALRVECICLVALAGEQLLGSLGAIPAYRHAWERHIRSAGECRRPRHRSGA